LEEPEELDELKKLLRKADRVAALQAMMWLSHTLMYPLSHTSERNQKSNDFPMNRLNRLTANLHHSPCKPILTPSQNHLT
jgi:hypothetical protein